MIRRAFTLAESVAMCRVAVRLRADGKPELADLCSRLAGGDDSVLPSLYDALAIDGRLDLAEALRRLVQE